MQRLMIVDEAQEVCQDHRTFMLPDNNLLN